MAREIDLYNQNAPMDLLSLQDAIALLKKEFEAHNHDGTTSRAFDAVRVLGHLTAPAGFIGGANNGIKIDSSGITIIGSGYIRTKDSGARLELVRSLTGGYTSAFIGYNSSSAQFMRLSADGGSPYLTMWSASNASVVPIQLIDQYSSNTAHMLYITAIGSNFCAHFAPSASAGGLYISNAAASTGAMIRLDPANLTADLIAVDSDGANVKGARITSLKYIQFPAYYHCSDFDENLAANTEISASVIAKAYWAVSGAGTKQMIIGANEDKSHYVRLATTTTSGRFSEIVFGRHINYLHSCIEARMIPTPITSAKIYFGMKYDADNFVRFKFDSTKHASRLYAECKNNGSLTSAQTTKDLSNSTWITLRIQNLSASVEFWADDVKLTTISSNYPTGDGLKPFVYVDNQSSPADKWLMVDFVKIWANRNDSVSYQ